MTHLKFYYYENAKPPNACDGVIETMGAVELALKFRTLLALTTLQNLQGLERSPVPPKLTDWINGHVNQVSKVDNACLQMTEWLQMWTFMLICRELDKDSIHEIMTKRLDAFLGFTYVEDIQLDEFSRTDLESDDEGAKLATLAMSGQSQDSGDVDMLVGQKQSQAPLPPVNKKKDISKSEAPISMPLYLAMLDISWVQPDGTVKLVPMCCLNACVRYIDGENNKLQLKFDTADAVFK